MSQKIIRDTTTIILLRTLCEFLPSTVIPSKQLSQGFTRVILRIPDVQEYTATHTFAFDIPSDMDAMFLNMDNLITDVSTKEMVLLWNENNLSLEEQMQHLKNLIVKYAATEGNRSLLQKVADSKDY